MWHGVTFNFLVWGLFHAVFFWISLRLLKAGKAFFPLLMLPIIVIFGRLIFADSDTSRLVEKLSFSLDGFSGASEILTAPSHSHISLFFGFFFVLVEFAFRNRNIMRKRNYKHLRSPIMSCILCILCLLFISNVGDDYAVYGQR